jgi:hypothetical protein
MEYVKNECRADLRLYLEWSLSGHPSVLEFRDQLIPALEEGGCKAEVAEVPHGVGWSGWRQRTDHILEALYPLQ